MNDWKNILIIILVLVSLILTGYIIYQVKNPVSLEETKITLHDTITLTNTVIEEHTKIQYLTKDSIEYIYKTDSITDTVFVEVPIEHKIYHDTIQNDSSFNDIIIRYSGWHSSIDEVNIVSTYTRKVDIPVQKQRKFHLSLQAGFGTMYDVAHKDVAVGPYFGIGGSYDLW